MIQSASNIVVRQNVLAASTGAGGDGVHILGGSGVTIQGNLVGLSVTMHDLGHYFSGITAMATTGLTIGGADGSVSNFIDCNRRHGIELQSCSGTIIQGNVIGSGSSGAEPLGNLEAGIYFFGCSSNKIGPHNEILYNGGAGVVVSGGTANDISWNCIYDNGGLGIDLGDDGPTVNDPGDADVGANQLQNLPGLDQRARGRRVNRTPRDSAERAWQVLPHRILRQSTMGSALDPRRAGVLRFDRSDNGRCGGGQGQLERPRAGVADGTGCDHRHCDRRHR